MLLPRLRLAPRTPQPRARGSMRVLKLRSLDPYISMQYSIPLDSDTYGFCMAPQGGPEVGGDASDLHGGVREIRSQSGCQTCRRRRVNINFLSPSTELTFT